MSKEIIVERGTKTVYRDGDTIVKQFKAGYPKSAVIKEAFNRALAEEVGLNVPELLGSRTRAKAGHWSFGIFRARLWRSSCRSSRKTSTA